MKIYSKYHFFPLLVIVPIIGLWIFCAVVVADASLLPLVICSITAGYAVGQYRADKNRAKRFMAEGQEINGKVNRIVKIWCGKTHKGYILEVEADDKKYLSEPLSYSCLNYVADEAKVYLLENEYFVYADRTKKINKQNRHVTGLRIDTYPSGRFLVFLEAILSVPIATVMLLVHYLVDFSVIK